MVRWRCTSPRQEGTPFSTLSRWLLTIALLQVALAGTAAAPPPSFDQDRAWAQLVRQCGFGPRVAGSAGYERCRSYLLAELSRYAPTVKRQDLRAIAAGRPVAFSNLLADFPAAAGAEHLLLCAHWDTRPRADREPRPADRAIPITGANDGASGVAVLLETARLLSSRPSPYHVTIALFDGEDYAPTAAEMFAGSRYYARQPWPARPAWGVLLDMVGDRDLRISKESHAAAAAPAVTNRVWAAARRAGVTAIVDRVGQSVMDDHWPLIDAGVPTTELIDFDYPHWHCLSDTPANCAAASLGQVGRVLEALLWPATPE